MENNSIILLPTGTGKTFIAFSVIQKMIDQTKGSFPNWSKRSIFLAPTKALIEQQHAEYVKFCKDTDVESIYFHGDRKVEGADKVDNLCGKQWKIYFAKYNVLFFTPQIFFGNICLFLEVVDLVCLITFFFILSDRYNHKKLYIFPEYQCDCF